MVSFKKGFYMKTGVFLMALVLGAFLYAGCSDGGGGPTGPSGAMFNLQNVSGSCTDVDPLGWAVKVTGVDRRNTKCDTTWTDPENILGEADGMFVSLGGDSGNSITVFMAEEIFDGPGCDMVVYETVTDEDDAYYDVYLSNSPDSDFGLVASVSTEGAYCIDLTGTGVSSGQYVKIVQNRHVDGFNVDNECDSTWGADIDAVGILNNDVCGDFDTLCDEIGAQVDLVCPPDDDYRNHGAYVSCVAHAATEFLREFSACFTEEEIEEVHGCVVSQRARTDIGK